MFIVELQIIATRPKGARRPGARRGAAKTQVLGTSNSPVTRARAAPTAPANKVIATPQTSEKIIVSNLPVDVNEVQIRVSPRRRFHTYTGAYGLYRSCSPQPLALCGM